MSDGLLFYDRSTGTGEFYRTDGSGSISLLRRYTGWSGDWSHILKWTFIPKIGPYTP
jgi:hypothetical protein